MNASQEEQERRVVCSSAGCLRKFKSLAHMQQHQADSHRKQAAGFPARVVKRSPTSPRNAATRVRKPLACGVCGALFREHSHLHQHLQDATSHRPVARQGSTNVCSECNSTFDSAVDLEQHFLAKHPVISIISKTQDLEERTSVGMHFQQKWARPGRKPTIVDIFRVHSPGHRTKRYLAYKARLNSGKEVSRYHGTTVRCDLGVGSRSLCSNNACNLCSIILSGFKKKKAEVSGFLRFGVGIYVTETSSKANDYVKAYEDVAVSAGGLTKRAMLVCKVLPGKVLELKEDKPDLVKPPKGYDSVAGVPGGSLNYDELVVYDNCAILPKYVLVYKL